MKVIVDATPLYDLGMVGETDLLASLAGDLVIPEAVRSEVDVEPAATNVSRLVDESAVETDPDVETHLDEAVSLLGDEEPGVDAAVVAGILAERADGDGMPCCGLVSDDRRLRRLGDGLGASVTSTFGVVVRAATEDKYFPASQAKRVLRRLDGHGMVTTGPLRAQAVGDVGGDE